VGRSNELDCLFGRTATYFQTQLELIGGRWTIDRVLDSEKIKQLPEFREQRDPGDYLMKHIRAARRGGSDLLDIRYSSPDKDIQGRNQVS
jgi:hypothetical protein